MCYHAKVLHHVNSWSTLPMISRQTAYWLCSYCILLKLSHISIIVIINNIKAVLLDVQFYLWVFFKSISNKIYGFMQRDTL